MTVGKIMSRTQQTGLGFKRHLNGVGGGTLWPRTFDLDGTTCEVLEIDLDRGPDAHLYVDFKPVRGKAAFNDAFTIWIGNRSHSFGDATYWSGNGMFRWDRGGGGHAENERVWVELVRGTGNQVAEPEPDPLTVSLESALEGHDGGRVNRTCLTAAGAAR